MVNVENCTVAASEPEMVVEKCLEEVKCIWSVCEDDDGECEADKHSKRSAVCSCCGGKCDVTEKCVDFGIRFSSYFPTLVSYKFC